MLTYRVRKRVFRRHGPGDIQFPAKLTIDFNLLPLQPFGMQPGGGRTVVRAVAGVVEFDANTGRHEATSAKPLEPLEVLIEEPARTVHRHGNTLSVTSTFTNLNEVNELLSAVYFALPILLNVEYADPPLVDSVTVTDRESTLRWELTDWRMAFATTTQAEQEEAFVTTWSRFGIISASHRRRLIAALHYFHVACRLERAGAVPGEFLAEVILNLAKTLEVLFPPSGNGKSIDAARRALNVLGFDKEAVERDFIPALALRNEIDVAHVHLAIFTPQQLRLLHAYTERAESAFRDLLKRVLNDVATGSYDVPAHLDLSPRAEAIAVLERLAEHTNEGG